MLVANECIAYLRKTPDGDFEDQVGGVEIDTEGSFPQLYVTAGEVTIGVSMADLFEAMKTFMREAK